MNQDHKKHQLHVAALTAGGFIAPFPLLILGFALFPPDLTVNPPVYSDGLVYFNELASGALIFACSLMAIKLADDRKVLPAAGFTMMAIATGVLYTTIFEAFDKDIGTLEGRIRTAQISVGGAILLVPAMLLIATYSEFPRWLNRFALLSQVPWLLGNAAFVAGYRDFQVIENVGTVGYAASNVVQVLWGVWVWKKRYEGRGYDG